MCIVGDGFPVPFPFKQLSAEFVTKFRRRDGEPVPYEEITYEQGLPIWQALGFYLVFTVLASISATSSSLVKARQ